MPRNSPPQLLDRQQTNQENIHESGMRNHNPESTKANTNTMPDDLEAGTYESMTVPVPETTYVPSITPSTSTTTTIAGSPSPTKDDDDEDEGKDKGTSVPSSLNAFFSRLRFPTTDDLVDFGKYVLIVFGIVIAVMGAVILVMVLFLAFTELLLNCSNNLKKVGGGGGGE